MTQAETLHNLMLAESAKTGLPQHFKRDLTFHDMEALNRMESEGRTKGQHSKCYALKEHIDGIMTESASTIALFS